LLRPKAISDLLKAATKGTAFIAEDFSVDAGSTSTGGSTANIVYRYDLNYRFQATIGAAPTSSDFKINCAIAPGVLNQAEKITVGSFDDLLVAVSSWAQRVNDELAAVPLYRHLLARQQEIDDLLHSFASESSDQFTADEVAMLKHQLDELRSLFESNIEEHTKSKSEISAKVSALNGEMDLLKRSLDTLTKKGWWSSLKVRTAKWSRDPDNVQLLKSGVTLAKALLPEIAGHDPSSTVGH
jgi:hypothetical protein